MRAMSSTARLILCTILASLIAVTPLGAHAHAALAVSDFVPDFCTAAASPTGTEAAPTPPSSHSRAHAQCGDCSTCALAFVPRASPGLPGILIVATPLDAIALPAPPWSLSAGIVARPRGPPTPG